MKHEICDTCHDTGIHEINSNGADIEVFCNCRVGIAKIEEDNMYHHGSRYYPFFTKEKHDKFYGVENITV